MVTQYEGDLKPPAGRFGVVVGRFNVLVTQRLLDGALDTLRRHGVAGDAIDVVWAPGSFEIPLVAKRLAESRRYAAVICLGCVLQGETPHHEYINQQAAAGIARAALDTGVPILFGVLTCDSLEQAQHRAGGKAGNKGSEAALAAIEMVNLLKVLSAAYGERQASSIWQSDSVASVIGVAALLALRTQDSALGALPMPRRSRAREVALQVLFQQDLNPDLDAQAKQEFIRQRLRDPDLQQLARNLVAGVHTKHRELDRLISEIAEHWTLERMAPTDRNVLRIGSYELLFTDTPPKVAIDEAVELAKRYGSAHSSQFVNGILDRVLKFREAGRE